MYKIIATCLLVLLPQALMAKEWQQVDQIVAIVNQDIILESELRQRTESILERFKSNQAVLPPQDELKKQVLDQLVMESLQLQLAEKTGIQADQPTINRALSEFARNNSIDLDSLAAEQPTQFKNLREQIARQINIAEVQRQEVRQRIQVNQTEINLNLNTVQGRNATQREYRLSYLRLSDQQKALNVKQSLLSPLLVSRQQPLQDLGYRTLSNLPSIIDTSDVTKWKTGDVFGPITASGAFHLFRLEDIRQGNTRKIDQYNLSQILIQPNTLLAEQQAVTLINSIWQQIQEGANFGNLARQYSDDQISNRNQGNLGWIEPSTLPQQVATEITNTRVGEITKPISIESGWVIFKLEDKRKQDVTDQELKNQIGQNLLENKFRLELPRWQNELKESAFIEVRI